MTTTDAASQLEPDALLTVKEYAALTRVHVQTVYTAIRYGRFKLPILKPTARTIRIIVPRGSIQRLTYADNR